LTRKKERLLAVERANRRRAMNNGQGASEGTTAPTHTRNSEVYIVYYACYACFTNYN